ncbi:hypothetical protein [Parapedobacter sp. 10938]|uniref:hypothetical protein n=1 Tax=Parapedobacter flavus TaxID=3110225 RepID=UPI002DBC76D9|nr:hypothetical protein [Parapedobacter sp. 10938]MEC3878226.1 hypothetical protein [Parapedobacter sp. 10938]
MHEVTIKYKSRKTLKALTALGEYLGFTISAPEAKSEAATYSINGVPVETGDASINIRELDTVFTGKNMDAASLRKSVCTPC